MSRSKRPRARLRQVDRLELLGVVEGCSFWRACRVLAARPSVLRRAIIGALVSPRAAARLLTKARAR